MKKRTLHKNLLLALLAAVCLLAGCISAATDYRKEGFNIIQRGFASLEDSPNLHEVIELKNVRVHIVGHRSLFSWAKAKGAAYGIAGYATTDNEIWIFGKIVNGKVIVNQAILGHEFNHLLNFKDPRIANPDLLDNLGA